MKKFPLVLVCMMFCFPVCNVAAETVTVMGMDGSIQSYNVSRTAGGVNVTQTMNLDSSMSSIDDSDMQRNLDIKSFGKSRSPSNSFLRGMELGTRQNRSKDW